MDLEFNFEIYIRILIHI